MKRLMIMLALAIGIGILPAAALASPITLAIGWSTSIGGPITTLISGPSALTYNGNVDGWTLVVETGTTASPNNPLLDLSSTAQCGSCSTALYVWLTGQGFTTAGGGVTSTISTNNSADDSSVTQSAWSDGSDAAFGQATSVGELGPYTGTGALGGALTGGGPVSGTYSLTLADGFAASGNYSADGSLAVPEPASLALLGTGLLALGFFFKRRITDATGLDLQA